MKQHRFRGSVSISLVLLILLTGACQNFAYENEAYGSDPFSFPLTVKDFALKYGQGPVFGKIVVGTPLVISTLLENNFSRQTNASYIIQVLDKSRSTISIQSKNVDISGIAPTELTSTWIPEVPGVYTIEAFVWSMDNDSSIAMSPKTSITVNVKPAPDVKTYTLCETGCDYSDFQKAIDHLHKPENKILVKDGNYELYRPVRVWSHTRMEFSPNAKITYLGAGNTTIFLANHTTNIEIVNAQITASTPNLGIKAFSFTSSSRINITGGEISLNKGRDSAGIYCRDCTNVEIAGISIANASRLIDVGSSSGANDGKSSKIWILNGKYESSSIEGIKINYSDKVYILGNNVSDTNDNAIDIGYSSHTLVSDNRIRNGGVHHGSGIHTDSAIGADIYRNVVNGTGESGITVYRASEINIVNNTITNTGSSGIAIIATEEPSSNIRVKHNDVRNSVGSWIYVSPNQENIVVSDNMTD